MIFVRMVCLDARSDLIFVRKQRMLFSPDAISTLISRNKISMRSSSVHVVLPLWNVIELKMFIDLSHAPSAMMASAYVFLCGFYPFAR